MLFVFTALALAVNPPSEEEKSIISGAVSVVLKDGESARYLWPDRVDPEGVVYCGFVNSKNSYGAYGGYIPFRVLATYSGTEYRVFDVELGEGADAPIVARLCLDDGYPVDPTQI